MGAAVKRLVDMVDKEEPYVIPYKELLPEQLEAANERFSERVSTIKVLGQRAEAAGIKAIRDVNDIVPLLFPHSSYKSYPENWFTEGKWNLMTKWLDTLTSSRVQNVDLKGVDDIDEWIVRLADAGHYVSCSSGTTGKCSTIPADMEDREFVKRSLPPMMSWATGAKPERQFQYVILAPVAKTFRASDGFAAQMQAFAAVERPFPGEPITVGRVSKMVALRRRIAEGTAKPSEITAFEATSAQRTREMEHAMTSTAEFIVAHRDKKILLQGLFATLWQMSEMVRGLGYSGKDFHPENVLSFSGGMKGAKLPPDFREQVCQTFNVAPQRTYLMYSMQEMSSGMPNCSAGRYHVPPWLMLLVLDQTGDNLMPITNGDVEGRAAFFDLSVSGRWCGLITGDKVRANYGPCACGRPGPTMSTDVVRYAEIGDDKITCAGTIDAYIRGAV
jgi:hypothetical protein